MESADTNNSTLVTWLMVLSDGNQLKWLSTMNQQLNCVHSTSKCMRECTATTAACQLNTSVPPVVAAKGGALNIMGCTSLAVNVTRLKVDVFISGGGSTDAGVHSWCGLPSATQVCHIFEQTDLEGWGCLCRPRIQ